MSTVGVTDSEKLIQHSPEDEPLRVEIYFLFK
jgi:hypothetical protein